MWYEDLTECDYFGEERAKILTAVGWLENGKSFRTGKVKIEVYEKLCELNKNPWLFYMSMGYHECEFCDKIDSKNLNPLPETWGTCNLTIPHKGKFYHYPELITHYIKKHSYLPPEEFCEAVLACPLMNTMEYYDKMVENGGQKFMKYFKEMVIDNK